MNGEALVLAQTDIKSSSEAMDGSECSASVVFDSHRVHELWVMSRFIMPSSREYEIVELRWMRYGDGYIAHIKGRRHG